MFTIFKKKMIDKNINAPVDGICIDITEVNDKTFSSKMLGDGFAIQPTNNIVVAPCNGEISMLFPTKHAFGIKTNDGKELLVHIGIDTVQLNGLGFEAVRNINDKVKKGDPIIKFNKEFINNDDVDITTMVIVTETNGDVYDKINIGKTVTSKECILQLKSWEET